MDTWKSHIDILRRFESKTLLCIANAPWFVNNYTMKNDLVIPTIKEEILRYSYRCQHRLNKHPIYLAINLLDNSN